MNILCSYKSLYCALQKSVRTCWGAHNVFVLGKRNLFNTSVNIKPIVFQPISSRRILDRKFCASPIARSYEKSIFDIDTNVKKNVLLFENTSSLFFSLNFLIPAQFAIWLFLTYQYVRIVFTLPPEYLTVFNLIDLSDLRWKYGVAFSFFFTGFIVTLGAFIYARKSVKQLILLRGGKSVYIETFGLFGLPKKHTVELEKLDCQISRIASKGYVPLKRLDTGSVFTDYLVDNEGHYPEPFLFDLTAGMQRVFGKVKK